MSATLVKGWLSSTCGHSKTDARGRVSEQTDLHAGDRTREHESYE